ncbi:MAG TPA: sigma-70 family RNA polymerase sigma factor [Longimicrobiales bacterium]|nr:sigma-70 family RNA polymerase sigma factor [Longimicrobiales bacterium]
MPASEQFRQLTRYTVVNSEAEWDLIRRCLAGSTAAFEPLVRHHERAALAIAAGLLGDRDDAADAVQEAFVRAYTRLDRLAAGSSFGAWFRTILRNVCLDRLKSAAARAERWTAATETEVGWAEAPALESVAREQLANMVHAALARLPAEHRSVLVLKEMDGLSYAEIATALGVPRGTVASRLYHARAALKRELAALGFTREDARS